MSSVKKSVAGKIKKDLLLLKSSKLVYVIKKISHKKMPPKILINHLSKFNNIISYFQNSPKKILENSQIELEFDTVFKLIKVKEIKWNSFLHY